MSIDKKKREYGQFFTQENPFAGAPFQRWAKKSRLIQEVVLEPFAGANNIIRHLESLGMCEKYMSFDISPANKHVNTLDTLSMFPTGYKVCVTNPPWLARNSATRRSLPFPECAYDDLYKHCLNLCLDNCAYVAALLPASYLQSRLFRDRLKTYILLHNDIFTDTENPVCLALFEEKTSKDVSIYYDKNYIGEISELKNRLPKAGTDKSVRFNDVNGNLGFISFDNNREPSIQFCRPQEIKDYDIKESSRFITRISGNFGNVETLIKKLNRKLNAFRKETNDVFLTPFKGIRADGCYRRRMDFHMARKFINAT